jgi:transposase
LVSILRSLYFHVHVAGAVVIRKRISRPKVLEHFGELPPCLIGIDACPSAHHCGRELAALGHTVKRIPPIYVKASTSGLDRGRWAYFFQSFCLM